jgi:histidinol-phosphate aminotransferase
MTKSKLNFLRSDLNKLDAYTPNPSGKTRLDEDRLDANECPLDLPQALKEKLAYLYQQEIENNRYPDGSHFQLKSAIASYVNQSANLETVINSDNISVGNGSDELIRSLLIATCLGGEGSILVAKPTFSMYQIIAETLAIPVVTINRQESDFSINIEEANQAIISQQKVPIRVVFVVHPNSPTGNCLNLEEINWLKNLSSEILVVIDEAYFEFSKNTLVGELNKYPNWVILRTFSKAFRLATHRVGYAIASGEVIKVLEKVRLPYNLPAFSQIAAKLALENSNLIVPYTNEIIKEKERVLNILKENSYLKVWSSEANFVYLRLVNNSSSENLENITKKLKQKGTIIRHTGGGLRITIGTREENNRTLEKLKSMLLRTNS